MTEDELVRAIAAHARTDDPRVCLGIGDDAAVLDGGMVVSVDAAVEGVHFERAWLSLEDVGYRGTVAALSDLAAMGAEPVAVLSSLALPDEREGERVMAGVVEAAAAVGATVVGGNLTRAGELALHSTVIGEKRVGAPWRRVGARVGDRVYVTGTLGSAALGWRLLGRGVEREPFATRWRRPTPRFDCVRHLAPTSCIDVSDGVVADLGHICAANGVGARIELAALPTDPELPEAAAALGLDADELAACGGEDYELLFTAPQGSHPAIGQRIGAIEEGQAVLLVDRMGTAYPATGGHRHF